MMSLIRLYMTFSIEWISTLDNPAPEIREAINVGLQEYGESCNSFDFIRGDVVTIELVSGRSGETLEDIVFETLLDQFETIHETDFNIEIDLDVDFGDESDD